MRLLVKRMWNCNNSAWLKCQVGQTADMFNSKERKGMCIISLFKKHAVLNYITILNILLCLLNTDSSFVKYMHLWYHSVNDESDSHHTQQTIHPENLWSCEAVTSRTESWQCGEQKMSEQCQKGKNLESACHGRRLGLCPVYLSLFLTATFLSVLTPCQPYLAGALWVAGRQLRWRYTKQAGWMGLTGLGSNGASLPDADNSGARGRGPETWSHGLVF